MGNKKHSPEPAVYCIAIPVWVFITAIFFINPVAYSQPEIRLKHYSTEEGLSQGTVYSMFQDSRSFMWFGTWDGLNRFDGYDFTHFKPHTDDSNSIGGSYINSILEDRDSNMWVGTNEALNMFDYKKNLFIKYYLFEKGQQKTGSYRVFYIDDKERLWINYNTKFICLFDIRSKRFEILEYTRGQLQYNEISNQNKQYFRPVSKLYIAGNGLRIIDVVKHTIDDRFMQKNMLQKMDGAELKAVYVDTGNTLWIASFKGVIEINISNGKCSLYNRDETNHLISGLSNIVPCDKDLFWLGSFGSGAFLFDKKARKIVRTIAKSEVVRGGLSENIVDEIYTDKEGNHWLSTQPTGVNMYNPRLLEFNTIRLNNDMARGAKSNSAQGITLIGSTAVVGFYQSGILKYDLTTGRQKIITLPRQDEEITVQTLFTDDHKNIWAGTDYGLFFSTDAAEHFKPLFKIKTYDYYDMYAFCANPAGGFFTGNSDGLFYIKYDGAKPRIKALTAIRDTIVSMAFISNGQYACSCTSGDLVLLQWQQDSLRVIKRLKMPVMVKHIEVQDSATLWLSTTSGIIIKNMITGKEEKISEKNGLSNQFVYAVLKGNDGNMWASTNDGIDRINISNHSVSHFSLSSGLQGKEFNTGSWHKDSNGMLLFGGTNGANYFNPASISIAGFKAPMQLIEVLVNGISARADSFTLSQPYPLSFEENNLSFSFTAIDFNRSDNILYSYRINNNGWTNIEKERTLRLLNLSEGDYEISIKAGLKSGHESPDILRLRFRISPPWYRTNRALLLFALLLIAAVYLTIRLFLYNKIKQQRALLEKQQAVLQERERILSDLHDDVGSGLSAIRMMSDLMSTKDTESANGMSIAQKISIITKDIAQRMNAIIWSLNAENDTLGNFTEYVRQYGITFFEDSTVDFHFNSPPDLPADIELNGIQRKNLFMITKEAFNNVLRHSGASSIICTVDIQEHLLCLSIKDNGHGMMVTNSFGNGLKNMRKRMDEINGALNISNHDGTMIILQLPLAPVSN